MFFFTIKRSQFNRIRCKFKLEQSRDLVSTQWFFSIVWFILILQKKVIELKSGLPLPCKTKPRNELRMLDSSIEWATVSAIEPEKFPNYFLFFCLENLFLSEYKLNWLLIWRTVTLRWRIKWHTPPADRQHSIVAMSRHNQIENDQTQTFESISFCHFSIHTLLVFSL